MKTGIKNAENNQTPFIVIKSSTSYLCIPGINQKSNKDTT